jgi:hypothetical protein
MLMRHVDAGAAGSVYRRGGALSGGGTNGQDRTLHVAFMSQQQLHSFNRPFQLGYEVVSGGDGGVDGGDIGDATWFGLLLVVVVVGGGGVCVGGGGGVLVVVVVSVAAVVVVVDVMVAAATRLWHNLHDFPHVNGLFATTLLPGTTTPPSTPKPKPPVSTALSMRT